MPTNLRTHTIYSYVSSNLVHLTVSELMASPEPYGYDIEQPNIFLWYAGFKITQSVITLHRLLNSNIIQTRDISERIVYYCSLLIGSAQGRLCLETKSLILISRSLMTD